MSDPNFFNMLIQYDANNVPMKIIKHVQMNYTEHEVNGQAFNPEVAKQYNVACQGFVQWVTGVVLYRSILE